MTAEACAKTKRVCQCLGAVAILALVTAQFERSPLRRPVRDQLQSLGYLRTGGLRDTADAAPIEQNGPADQRLRKQPTVRIDFPGGFYRHPLKITLSQSGSAPIFYTLDGGPPNEEALRYHQPIVIERTTVLRFGLPGREEQTHTYVIGDSERLPVLSLAIDPVLLWNRHVGIYRNAFARGRAWTRPAHAELLMADRPIDARVPVELKIRGNWSRHADKKSFRLSYSTARVKGTDLAIVAGLSGHDAAHRMLIARPTGIDVSYRLGDELFHALFSESGGLVVRSAKVQLLLNGQAWGLYNLHEKISKEYLQRTYGPGEYDLVDDAGYRPWPDTERWNQLLEFFSSHDLSNDSEYAKAMQFIDGKNFTDYWLFNIYAGNLDWPNNNYFAFRNRSGDGRWRWISWDTDAAFDIDAGLHHDTLAWATRAKLRDDLAYDDDQFDFEEWLPSTLIIRGLLKNADYRAHFVRRFCELRYTYFEPNLLQARFQRLLDNLAPDFRVDWERWPGSKKAYMEGVQGVRRFIAERPAIVLEQFRKQFGFSSCPAV